MDSGHQCDFDATEQQYADAQPLTISHLFHVKWLNSSYQLPNIKQLLSLYNNFYGSTNYSYLKISRVDSNQLRWKLIINI